MVRNPRLNISFMAGVVLLAALQAGAAGPVNFAPSLIVVSAVHDVKDYEATAVVNTVSPAGYVRTLHWVYGDGKESTAQMSVRAEDVESGRRLILVWIPGDPESMPGSLSGRISRLQYQELQQKGESAFVLGAVPAAAGADTFGGLLTGRKYYRGTLRRVEPGPVPFSVLLDGARTTISALHIKGQVSVGKESGNAEFWILNDPDIPMILRWQVLGSAVTVVKIDNPPTPRTANKTMGGSIDIANALSSGKCRAEIPGIYFNTGSAKLLPESAVALQKISAIAKAQPWTLTIEGHTDNIGSADANLQLSRARATAVRDTLVRNYGIAPARLTATGFGATRPVESNATIEGRAHNRRVELSRVCK